MAAITAPTTSFFLLWPNSSSRDSTLRQPEHHSQATCALAVAQAVTTAAHPEPLHLAFITPAHRSSGNTVGPEMIPSVDLKYNVNTHTRILVLKK